MGWTWTSYLDCFLTSHSHGFHPVGQLRRFCASSFVLLNVDGGICPVHCWRGSSRSGGPATFYAG